MADYRLGRNARIYLNTGTYDTPVWAMAQRARDIKVDPLGAEEVDVSVSASKFKLTGQGLIEMGVGFGYLPKPGTDTILQALLDSQLDGDDLDVLILQNDISVVGTKGYRAFLQVFSGPLTSELSDAQRYEFMLKPTLHEEDGDVVEPSVYTVAS